MRLDWKLLRLIRVNIFLWTIACNLKSVYIINWYTVLLFYLFQYFPSVLLWYSIADNVFAIPFRFQENQSFHAIVSIFCVYYKLTVYYYFNCRLGSSGTFHFHTGSNGNCDARVWPATIRLINIELYWFWILNNHFLSGSFWDCPPIDTSGHPNLILERDDRDLTVTFKCSPGSRLKGIAFSRCYQGDWTHTSLPRCQIFTWDSACQQRWSCFHFTDLLCRGVPTEIT